MYNHNFVISHFHRQKMYSISSKNAPLKLITFRTHQLLQHDKILAVHFQRFFHSFVRVNIILCKNSHTSARRSAINNMKLNCTRWRQYFPINILMFFFFIFAFISNFKFAFEYRSLISNSNLTN